MTMAAAAAAAAVTDFDENDEYEFDVNKINCMRLRVNRINLIKTLIIDEDLLNSLQKRGLIDANERKQILSDGHSREDKARNLIDCLIVKQSKLSNGWYDSFRSILLERNYRELVVFLDNTITKRPKLAEKMAIVAAVGQPQQNKSLLNSDLLKQQEQKKPQQNILNNKPIIMNNHGVDEKQQQQQQQPNRQIFNHDSQMTFSSNNSKASAFLMRSPKVGKNNRNYNNGFNFNNYKQNIDDIEFDDANLSQIKLKGNFERLVTGLATYSNRPTEFFASLEKSNDPDDQKQLTFELETFAWFNKLELLYSYYKTEKDAALLKDSFFLDTNVVHNVLNNFYSHLNMKYYKNLQDTFNIDMLAFFKCELVEKLRSKKLIHVKFYESLEDLINKIVWILIRNDRHDQAKELLIEFLNYLNQLELVNRQTSTMISFKDEEITTDPINHNNTTNKTIANPASVDSLLINNNNKASNNANNIKQQTKAKAAAAATAATTIIDIENFIDEYKISIMKTKFFSLCALLAIENHLMSFKKAVSVFNRATDILQWLNENNQDVDCTLLFYGIGTTLLEIGNFRKSLQYINKSLLTLNYDAEILVDVLGSAVLSLTSNWMLNKAESVAILAIQATKSFYETNHSQFVRALLYYCHFSNEFIQDESSIEICQYTLRLAKKVFGYDSMVVAEAYRSMSKALINSKLFDNDYYYEYARRSYEIAVDHFPKNFAKLITYQVSLVLALQTKALQEAAANSRNSETYLNQAYELCLIALENCIASYEKSNFSTAKIYRILGTLLYYMHRDEESEQMHQRSIEIIESILSPGDLHNVFAKGILGLFYKLTGRINDAVSVLIEVTKYLKEENVANVIAYCKWMPILYSNLSECYRAKKVTEYADNYQKQADKLRQLASSRTNKYDILKTEMHRNPPYNLNEALNEIIRSSN